MNKSSKKIKSSSKAKTAYTNVEPTRAGFSGTFYELYLERDLISINDASKILCGENPDKVCYESEELEALLMHEEDPEYIYPEQHILESIKMSILAKNLERVEENEKYYVTPSAIVSWAITKGIKLPAQIMAWAKSKNLITEPHSLVTEKKINISLSFDELIKKIATPNVSKTKRFGKIITHIRKKEAYDIDPDDYRDLSQAGHDLDLFVDATNKNGTIYRALYKNKDHLTNSDKEILLMIIRNFLNGLGIQNVLEERKKLRNSQEFTGHRKAVYRLMEKINGKHFRKVFIKSEIKSSPDAIMLSFDPDAALTYCIIFPQ